MTRSRINAHPCAVRDDDSLSFGSRVIGHPWPARDEWPTTGSRINAHPCAVLSGSRVIGHPWPARDEL